MSFAVTAHPVDTPESLAVLWDYFEELCRRYWDRPVSAAEVDQAMREEPSGDLVPPTGAFLLARAGVDVLGCVGVRLLAPEVAELTRMYVRPSARGRGVAMALVAGAERAAVALGAHRMLLDTRSDLVEARGLYRRCGYVEGSPHNSSPYADHWFAKALA
ncbi:GNAT superfamily N-acetyltransferase [Crossiella equi]|uniref:GNAT superfamily N-acetyltransferase n=1 Tax=Crossiella equi TaxID=130796 RepID=A0ABS5A646_9PSEU|nr:GNAT family N-acetyltransferase [Crossiella equi]MBP2472064.1 GNAT superfamily N-acetyltransferase [Crossiella equi]